MQLAQSYLQGQAGPFDGVLEAYGKGQVFRENKDLLQAKQAEQARKIAAQQQLETIDWNDKGAIARTVAQFPEYTKGAKDYYDALEQKEQQSMLYDMSTSISALSSDRPDIAVQNMRDKANAYRDAGNEEKAEEYSQMAEWMAREPKAAQRALLMHYAVLSPEKSGANYENYIKANVAEDAAPVDREATQAKTVNERVTAAGGVNKIISTAALTDDPNTFMEMIDTAYDAGLIAPEKYNSLVDSVSGDGEEAVATLRRLARGNPDIIDKLLPDVKYTDLGDGVAINSFDPQTGGVKTLGTMEKGINPETIYKEDSATARNTYSQDSATNRTVYTVDQQAENVDKQEETKRQNAALTAAQAKEKLELERGEAVKTTINGKVWLFYPKLNKLRAVVNQHGEHLKDASAVKPPNESQANSLMYGERMQTANNILADIESSNKSWDVKGGDVLARVNPKGGTEDFKKYEQAKRNFINAVLRKESGAAIAESEFESANKQYFPQIGDTPDVIAQKAATRKQVTERMLNNAGPQGTSLISKPVDTSKFVKK